VLFLKTSDHNGVVNQAGGDVHSVLPLLILSVSAFIIVLLFLLLAVDLSTASVGAGLEHETPDIGVSINFFGISSIAELVRVLRQTF